MKKQSFKSREIKESIEVIKDWCEKNLAYESCGFLGQDQDSCVAELHNNESEEPRNTFSLNAFDYLMFMEKYKPIAVFHSHVAGDEKESEKDIIMSENSCLPFLIYSLNTKKFNLYIPKKSEVNVDILEEIKQII